MLLPFVGECLVVQYLYIILPRTISMSWCDNKCPCCSPSRCHDLVMNVHAARNPTGWYGHTPCCGAVINSHDAYHPLGCGCDKWTMIRQLHRGCTFDSPGLPTIGGYPGEQGVRDATPLGVVLSLFVLSNTSHVTIRGIASS